MEESASQWQLAINDRFTEQTFVDAWRSEVDVEDENVSKIAEPFRCCLLKEFISMENVDEFLSTLRREIQDGEICKEKGSDMFEFAQSNDLEVYESPAIRAITSFFGGPVLDWMTKVTGIQLEKKVALSASIYEVGSYLLCHDDHLEGRRIAFAYYLTPQWTVEDGGSLDVFKSDENLNPTEIVHSFVPNANRLSFFEVGPRSFHQVSEVMNWNDVRMSVHGWYFGEPLQYPVCPASPMLELRGPLISSVALQSFLNPEYLNDTVMESLKSFFTENSYSVLTNFLQDEVYERIYSEVSGLLPEMWQVRGPWNKRRYLSLKNFDASPTLDALFKLFASDQMYKFLSSVTGLELKSECTVAKVTEDSEAPSHSGSKVGQKRNCQSPKIDAKKVRKDVDELSTWNGDVRKFTPGCYKLQYDTDKFKGREDRCALEAIFYFAPKDWPESTGLTVWVLADEQDDTSSIVDEDYGNAMAIISNPEANALSLVYREESVRSFVQYLGHIDLSMSTQRDFVDMHFTYYD